LSDAQFAIAREYGFSSWTRLKRHVEKPTASDSLDLPHHERIESAVFRRAVDLLDAGDTESLRSYLNEHPRLVHHRVTFEGGNYFRNPTLLQFVAENPIRRGTLPANIVQVAKLILEAGAKSDLMGWTRPSESDQAGSIPQVTSMALNEFEESFLCGTFSNGLQLRFSKLHSWIEESQMDVNIDL
jgi:hypothetical protein